MQGIVAPTDSRYRKDVRCFEDGNFEQAEIEKNIIEQR